MFGSTAELVMAVKVKDEASQIFKEIKDAGGGMFDNLDAKAKAAGAFITGAGGALEAFARSQQQTTIQVQQNAAMIDMAEGEYRKLANSIHDATTPLGDALDLMELAGERGLRDGDAIREYANFWGLVGDATGESAVDLASAGVALANVGVDIHNQTDALDAFGFIQGKTTQDVGDFMTLLERRGPSIRNFGLDINDTAAFMGIMEDQLGLTALKARQEFERAIKDANSVMDEAHDSYDKAAEHLLELQKQYEAAGGAVDADFRQELEFAENEMALAQLRLDDLSNNSLGLLVRQLGLTEEQFHAVRAEVDGSSDVIHRNAQITRDAVTPLQEWEQRIKAVIFEHQHLISGLAEFAPIMLVAGPAIGMGSAAIRGLGTAATFARGPLLAMGAALLTPPIGLVVALVAAGVAVYVFRDDILGALGAAWDFIKGFAADTWDVITGAFNSVMDFARNNWPEIVTLISGPFLPIVALATDAFGVRSALEGAITGAVDWTERKFNELISFLEGLPGRATAAGSSIGRGVGNGVIDSLNRLLQSVGGRELIPGNTRGPITWSAVTLPTPPMIPRLDRGTPFVPRDMLALIHKGEAVVPARFNPHNPDNPFGSGRSASVTLNINGDVHIDDARRDTGPIGDMGYAIVRAVRSRGL